MLSWGVLVLCANINECEVSCVDTRFEEDD